MTNTALKYGLFAAIVVILFHTLTTTILSPETQRYVSWFDYVIYTGAIVLACRELRNKQGYLTFGNGVGAGVLLCLAAGLLVSLYTYVYMTAINPKLLAQMKELAYQEMEKSADEKGMNDEQREMMMTMGEKMMSPVVLTITSFLGTVLVGLILSLIVAAIMKKNPTPEQLMGSDPNQSGPPADPYA